MNMKMYGGKRSMKRSRRHAGSMRMGGSRMMGGNTMMGNRSMMGGKKKSNGHKATCKNMKKSGSTRRRRR